MRKILLSIVVVIALASVSQAQDKESFVVQSLTRQLNYYQNKSLFLTKHSKQLTRKVTQLDTKNKRLVIKVEELRRDSLQLRKLVQDALTDNQQLVKSYEKRILGMAGELHALHDSLADLKIVKRDLDVIKHYFDTALLAKREYDLPVYKVVQALNNVFGRLGSPYQIKINSGQELVIVEDFTVRRQTFLFIKANVRIQGEYKITLKSHPFDEGKTLVDCRDTFQRKYGDTSVEESQYSDKVQAENRLFSYIDKAIYSNDLHTQLPSRSSGD